MKIGYARVSTLDQNLDLQCDALKSAGCERVIEDQVSGTVAKRPGLEEVKKILRDGDTLVVWRLDRLGRSLRDLIAWAGYLDEQGVALQSLHEAIDTSTPSGKLTFHLFGALSEFERNLIQERTQAGLAAARARGRLGGRRKALDPDKRALAVDLYQQKNMPVGKICEVMGISKPTLYTDFPPSESAKPLASTGLDGNFGFHAGGYIVTSSRSSICSCSSVGVLF